MEDPSRHRVRILLLKDATAAEEGQVELYLRNINRSLFKQGVKVKRCTTIIK